MLKIDLGDSIKVLKKNNAKRVFVQVPEGLKTKTDDIIEELEKKGFSAVASMDPCFGACDLSKKKGNNSNATQYST